MINWMMIVQTKTSSNCITGINSLRRKYIPKQNTTYAFSVSSNMGLTQDLSRKDNQR